MTEPSQPSPGTVSHLGIRWLWLLFLPLVVAGLFRLRLDVDVLNLLPPDLAEVQALKLYQSHFAKAQELVITLQGPDAEQTQRAARAIGIELLKQTNFISRADWQVPWRANPVETGELVAYIWFNQPPQLLRSKAENLAPENLSALLTNAREELATSFSPATIARASYDPFGFSEIQEAIPSAVSGFNATEDPFCSADGRFRVIHVLSRHPLRDFPDSQLWLNQVRQVVAQADFDSAQVEVLLTGAPVFAASIATDMERDTRKSATAATGLIIVMFLLAHRRWKPLLWLLILLGLVLLTTLGLGGLIFGAINIVSLGFFAILIGLAVDYALVHYQEAVASPHLSIPSLRKVMARGILCAAATTVGSFLLLNFGGLPGLAQLGTLVALGVALSAAVMVFEYLPWLFPERRDLAFSAHCQAEFSSGLGSPGRPLLALGSSAIVTTGCLMVLLSGFPRLDTSADALRPRNSEPYAALELVRKHLNPSGEALWLLIQGTSEQEVLQRLGAVESILAEAVSQGMVASYSIPGFLWPHLEFQVANRDTARDLGRRHADLRQAAADYGFESSAFVFTERVLESLRDFGSRTDRVWPQNASSQWILDKVSVRTNGHFIAAGMVHPHRQDGRLVMTHLGLLQSKLSTQGALLSGWEFLGSAVFAHSQAGFWKITTVMTLLVLVSLFFAFHRAWEVVLSVAAMALGGACLLATMRLANWPWNLMNLMAVPLILGTGVDYGIFMQRTLRRHQGNLRSVWRSLGKALLLCGGTAVAGFGSLSLSQNTGMASLGKVCALGIAFNVLVALLFLPGWWLLLWNREQKRAKMQPERSSQQPSSFYRAGVWRMGMVAVRWLPLPLCIALARLAARLYFLLARQRVRVVTNNLLPAVNFDAQEAQQKARDLFLNFALKVVDLWRYEAGVAVPNRLGVAFGWGHFAAAQAQNKGVLLLSLHLGNWEFGGPWLAQKGFPLQVISLAEPGQELTELRRASRQRWNVETLVIRDDPFAFLEIIQRLNQGATVALLMDRPPASTGAPVELFGQPFSASVAAAELARATGCVLLPVYVPRLGEVYNAYMLPAIAYNRAALQDRTERNRLTQQIMEVFAPVIATYPDQWYHFVPIWPVKKISNTIARAR